tara:strand:+ start:6369 stop:6641 length:273 start_codon:yes stop_codon:yes gene_type:complete
MDDFKDKLKSYDEGRRFALECVFQDLELLVGFMDVTELKELEEGCYNTLVVVTEVLRQRVEQLSKLKDVQGNHADNVINVDFNSIKRRDP